MIGYFIIQQVHNHTRIPITLSKYDEGEKNTFVKRNQYMCSNKMRQGDILLVGFIWDGNHHSYA